MNLFKFPTPKKSIKPLVLYWFLTGLRQQSCLESSYTRCCTWYFFAKLFSIGIFFTIASYASTALAQDYSAEIKKMFTTRSEVDITIYDVLAKCQSPLYYYISGDTLYAKETVFGISTLLHGVALKDIDFSKTLVRYAVFNKNSKGELADLIEIKCFNGKTAYYFSGYKAPEPDKTNMNVYFSSRVMANQALVYLKKLSESKKSQSGGNDLSDLSNFDFSYKPGNNASVKKDAGASKSEKSPVTGSQASGNYPADFDSQLNLLINGLKDNYTALRGKRIENGSDFYTDYECKIKLEHAESTQITVPASNSAFILAEFGEFELYSDAELVYKIIREYIESCKKLPCNLVITEDVAEKNMCWRKWEEDDKECQQSPQLKGFSMELKVLKITSTKLMKQNIFKSLYNVSLTINP